MFLVASASAFTLWTCDSDTPATSLVDLKTWYDTMADDAYAIQDEVEAWLADLDLSACPVTTCTTCLGTSACTCEEVVCELADGSAVNWRVAWGEGLDWDLEWREDRVETWSVQTAAGVSLDSVEEDLSYASYEQTYTATWTGSLGGSLPDDGSLDWTYFSFDSGHDVSWSVPGCNAEIDTDIIDDSWDYYLVRIGPSTGEVSVDWFDGIACPTPMQVWGRLDEVCVGVLASTRDWTLETADGDGDCELAPRDCDDANPTVNRCATDDTSDGVDQDCSGFDFYDGDGDGEEAMSIGGRDCDDSDPDVCDACEETPYDGVDQDCSGADLADVDQDGHDAVVAGGDDCDETDADIHPGAPDIPYDGLDQNCDGADVADVDGDGYTADFAGGDDCHDADPSIHPGALEWPYDGIDQDCDGGDLVDADLDGHEAEVVGGDDCDDADHDISPSADEIPCDGIDQDCDGSDLEEGCAEGAPAPETPAPPAPGCATVPAPGALPLLAAAALARRGSARVGRRR